jgi:lipopolysaccharide transport system ATP-binding protein
LQILCGTVHPYTRSVAVEGRVAALLELSSGFDPEFTGRENVHLNASVLGLSRREVDDRFDDITAFADIGDFINQPIKTYSTGMVVRLAFAVIAHVNPISSSSTRRWPWAMRSSCRNAFGSCAGSWKPERFCS